MDKKLSRKVHTGIQNILVNSDFGKSSENTRVAIVWFANRYVFDRERNNRFECIQMAVDDRSAKSSQQVDQTDGKRESS